MFVIQQESGRLVAIARQLKRCRPVAVKTIAPILAVVALAGCANEVSTPRSKKRPDRNAPDKPAAAAPDTPLPTLNALPAPWKSFLNEDSLDVHVKEHGKEHLFLARAVLPKRTLSLRTVEGKGLRTTSSLLAGCTAGINAGYFDKVQKASMSLLFNGKKISVKGITELDRGGAEKKVARAALGIGGGLASTRWTFPEGTAFPLAGFTLARNPSTAPLSGASAWDVDLAVGGGPMLRFNGTTRVTWKEELFDDASGIGVGSKQPRTAAGVDATGHILYLLVSDGRSAKASGHTLEELADLMGGLGAHAAINFDGGGSSTFFFKTKAINRPSDGSERPVYSALCLK